MPDAPRYHDPNQTKPERVTVAFTDEETARVHRLAEAYAALCKHQGKPIPPDPMRALLECCEHMEQTIAIIQAAHDKAVLDAEHPGLVQ